MADLAGQVALVTGGGRGLGRVAALALAGRGMRVAVVGRTPDPLDEVVAQVRAGGGTALAVAADVTDRWALGDAVRRTEAELGPVDLLVANAGRFAVGGPVWESDPDDWWRDVEVNLRGPLLCLAAVLPGMVSRGRGRVVVTGSGFANRPVPHGSAYSASKAAAHRLVEAAAGELRGTGVSAFTVSPGFVETEMTRGFPAGFTAGNPEFADPEPERWTPPERFAELVGEIASGRLDPLSGRFLHVTTDLDAALAAAEQSEEPGTLRLVPYD